MRRVSVITLFEELSEEELSYASGDESPENWSLLSTEETPEKPSEEIAIQGVYTRLKEFVSAQWCRHTIPSDLAALKKIRDSTEPLLGSKELTSLEREKISQEKRLKACREIQKNYKLLMKLHNYYYMQKELPSEKHSPIFNVISEFMKENYFFTETTELIRIAEKESLSSLFLPVIIIRWQREILSERYIPEKNTPREQDIYRFIDLHRTDPGFIDDCKTISDLFYVFEFLAPKNPMANLFLIERSYWRLKTALKYCVEKDINWLSYQNDLERIRDALKDTVEFPAESMALFQELFNEEIIKQLTRELFPYTLDDKKVALCSVAHMQGNIALLKKQIEATIMGLEELDDERLRYLRTLRQLQANVKLIQSTHEFDVEEIIKTIEAALTSEAPRYLAPLKEEIAGMNMYRPQMLWGSVSENPPPSTALSLNRKC